MAFCEENAASYNDRRHTIACLIAVADEQAKNRKQVKPASTTKTTDPMEGWLNAPQHKKIASASDLTKAILCGMTQEMIQPTAFILH